MSRESEIESLRRRAFGFLKTADFQYNESLYDLAIFSLEQGLQLFLKAKLLEYGVEYPRTRSVRRLLEILMDVSSEESGLKIRSLLDKYMMELGVLEDAYITSRYLMRGYIEGEVDRLRDVAWEVINSLG